MSRAQMAVDLHTKGYNCSQAVFSTYCSKLGIDPEEALKIACGFGGGMGRLGETCGAVTGAYMLIGAKYGKVRQDDDQVKEKTYGLVQKFTERFIEKNGHIRCRDLLGVDLIKDDKDLIRSKTSIVCSRLIKDASEIIEDMLEL